MTAPTTALIQVQRLSHSYLRGTPLETQSLRDVDFEVHSAEVVGVVGPTGSGKSTLLQHLNGLFRPQQGHVYVSGLSLSDPELDIRTIRQRVGLVFQNPEDQLFERYAGDDVAFGPRSLGLPAEGVRKRVRQAMEAVGLPFAYKDRLTVQLSQGQRRRLALAGVLALKPQVLVLDEPTAGLDPQGRRELLRTLAHWPSEDRAIVVASHNMEDIAELCTRVYVLVEGRIVLQGPPRGVFSEGQMLMQNGLSVPAATQAMLLLRQRGYPVSANVLTIEEAATEIERYIHAHGV